MKKITFKNVRANLCQKLSIADGPWSPPRRAGMAGAPQNKNSLFFKRKFSLGCTMVYRIWSMVHRSWPMAGFLQRKNSTLKRKICPGNKTTMVYRLLTMVLFSLFTSLAAPAQQTIQPLAVGERLPNIPLHVLNYKKSAASLADFQQHYSRMVLLDFWITSCGPCIRSFAKLDSLQHQFNDQLQILLVTKEDSNTVKETIVRWEQATGKKLTIPLIVNDSLLSSYIRRGYNPHYAWIAPDRTLLAQTDYTFISATILQDYLKMVLPNVELRGNKKRDLENKQNKNNL